MKAVFKIIICIFLIACGACIACHKEKQGVLNINPPPPPPPSSPQGKIIMAKVVEFGTDNPIAGAVINLRSGYPNGNTLNLTTDGNGVCSFVTATNQFGHISVIKPGYWNLEPQIDYGAPVFFFPDTIQYTPYNDVSKADSFVVKLFPIWNLTVHLKDTSNSHRNTGFTNHGLFNVNRAIYNRYGSWMILRPGIDTTFQLAGFGNTDNKFGIWKSNDDDYFMWGEALTVIRYIAVGDNITVNVFY